MVAENTPVVALLELVDALISQRQVMYAHVAMHADEQTLLIVRDFLVAFDQEVEMFSVSVESTQRVVARVDCMSRAYAHLKELEQVTHSSSNFAKLAMFKTELAALIEQTKSIPTFVYHHLPQ